MPEHGRYSTYVNHDCRCEPCRTAAREYRRSLYYRRKNGEPKRQRIKTAKPLNPAPLNDPESTAFARNFSAWQEHELKMDTEIIGALADRARETIVYGRSVTSCPRGYWRTTPLVGEEILLAHVVEKERRRKAAAARYRARRQQARVRRVVGARKRYAR